jgi:hypothetical protein
MLSMCHPGLLLRERHKPDITPDASVHVTRSECHFIGLVRIQISSRPSSGVSPSLYLVGLFPGFLLFLPFIYHTSGTPNLCCRADKLDGSSTIAKYSGSGRHAIHG